MQLTNLMTHENGVMTWITTNTRDPIQKTSSIHDGHVSVLQEGMDAPNTGWLLVETFDWKLVAKLHLNMVLFTPEQQSFHVPKFGLAKEQDRVIGLYHRGGHLWAAPHCERDLALLAVIHGQTLQHKAAQTGSSATTASVVHTEPLQT